MDKVGHIKKYLTEYAILCLAGSVIFLFHMVNDLNTFIRENLHQQNMETKQALRENTSVMQQVLTAERFYRSRGFNESTQQGGN